MTSLVLLVISALAYAAGIAGLVLTLPAPWGYLVLAAGGLVPGVFLLHRAAEDRSNERVIVAGRPETWSPPPGPASSADGNAPEPLAPYSPRST